MIKVVVVILNYNGRDFLRQFLPSFVRFSGKSKIIVADNASLDDSVDTIESEFPGISVIRLPVNYGFAGGYNEALGQIDAEYFVIVNSDIEVTENWLSPLITFLDTHPDYAGCQPKILSQRDKTHFEYAGAGGGFIDAMGYPYCRGRIFEQIETDLHQYDEIIDTFWVSGACMVIRSKDFHEAGGFDADFFAHMEEIDLCWRLHGLNRKLACLPESVVYHFGGGTLSKSSPRKTYLNFRNGLSLLLKNLLWYQLWKIPVRMILDVIAGFKFWMDNSVEHLFAILRAHFHFLTNIWRDIKKRKSITHRRIDRRLIHSKHITFDRFILRKKKFSDLS